MASAATSVEASTSRRTSWPSSARSTSSGSTSGSAPHFGSRALSPVMARAASGFRPRGGERSGLALCPRSSSLGSSARRSQPDRWWPHLVLRGTGQPGQPAARRHAAFPSARASPSLAAMQVGQSIALRHAAEWTRATALLREVAGCGGERLHSGRGDPTFPGTDMARYVRELMAFCRARGRRLVAIRQSAPFVLATSGAHHGALRSLPAVSRQRAVLSGEDGRRTCARLERRKHSLGRWLRETAEVATRAGLLLLPARDRAVAQSPGARAGRRGAGAPHGGAMSLAQSALAGVFAADMADPREALAASVAWNKLLLVQLNVLLLGYLPVADVQVDQMTPREHVPLARAVHARGRRRGAVLRGRGGEAAVRDALAWARQRGVACACWAEAPTSSCPTRASTGS